MKQNKKYITEADDSFGVENMQELIDKNNEELEKTKLALKKAEEDKKNTETKARLEKNTASRMPNTNNPTDDASMDKVGMEASVNKKKPLYAKKERELGDQIKNLSDRIKYLEDTIKTQEETLDNMEREKVSENRIIKVKDIKSVVENFNKINLSESDIINILVDTQNPVMKKSEIVESIQNKLIFEAEMDRNVRDSFEGGNNDYSDIIGSDLSRELANKSFDEIARAITQKTGKANVTLDDVQQLMSASLMNAAREEFRYGTDRLERKAVDMIRKQFNIPEDAVEFEATITGVPAKALGLSNAPQQVLDQASRQLGVKVGEIQREGLKYDKGNEPVPEGKTEEQMKPKIKRRRLTNAMMHGAARKSQNLHHMDDELRQENPNLSRDYANLMAANDASYWMMSDETIKDQGRSGIHAGNVRVKLSDQPGGKPKIIAQGVVFPVLLHELAKGVVELMSLWSLPTDAADRKYVLDKTDNLDSETNDIRLGPIIWAKFVEQIPVDNQEVISLAWNMLQELSDYDFNSIVEGLLGDRTDAQTKVRRIAEEAMDELRREASDDTFGLYGDKDDEEGDTTTPDKDGDEGEEGEYTDPLLKKLLGGDKEAEEEGPQDINDLDSMSDDQLRNLMRSAIEDEDYEFASQIRDILKNR